MAIRVLIADDHEVVRCGMRNLIQQADDIEIVAEATTGAEAVEKTLSENPDVVLLDIRMPGGMASRPWGESSWISLNCPS